MITEFNDQQKYAIDKMIDFCHEDQRQERMFLLKGSAGTGKTTCIHEVVKARPDLKFVMTAPTNKATKVLREIGERGGTEGIPCATIYSLLGLRVKKDSEFIRVEPLGESGVTNFNIVVIDEASMINEQLMGFVEEAALDTDAKFIFMGDPLQLPPVGEDNSRSFAIDHGAELTKVERHDNQILTFATSLRDCIQEGGYPNIVSDNDENGGVYTVDSRRMRKHLEKAYTSENYQINPNSCKTIAWRNVTVNGYNEMIRSAIYGDRASEMFVLDERVVATHPIPEVFGDVQVMTMMTDEEGNVVELETIQHPMFEDYKVYHLQVETEFGDTWANCFVVHPDSLRDYTAHLGELAAEAKKGRMPWSSFWGLKNEFMHDIRPCHAITAHRSQGSTYRSVFVDVQDIMSNRNRKEALRCLYVAATRASDVLVLKTR